MPPRVFLSYHDEDKKYRAAILKQLAHPIRMGKIAVWDKTDIMPGKNKSAAVKDAIDAAQIALVLVSPDWHADGRMECERISLLRAAFIDKRIIPLLLFVREDIASTMNYELVSDQDEIISIKLTDYQAINEYGSPLNSLNSSQQDSLIAKAASVIMRSAHEIEILTEQGQRTVEQNLSQYLMVHFKELSTLRGTPVNIMNSPDYEDQNIRRIAERLCELRARRTKLIQDRADIIAMEAVRDAINAAKLELRQGRLRAGDFLLDNYRLIRTIGFGGFGCVWLAYDMSRKTNVAIKILHNDLISSKEHRYRFRSGAATMKNLCHPNIVSIVATCDESKGDNGAIFYVMEYAQDGDFFRKICEKSLSEEQILDIIISIGSALSYAHELGIIHRDVKPHNILIGTNGIPLLTDFDLVRTDARGLTTTNAMVGAPLYTDPESLVDDIDMNPKIDVYSLAVTTIEALSQSSLSGQSIFDRFEYSINQLTASSRIKNILKKAVSKQETRFPTMADFCKALRDACDSRKVSKISASPISILRNIAAFMGIFIGLIFPSLAFIRGIIHHDSLIRMASILAPLAMFLLYITWVLHFPHRERETAEIVSPSILYKWLISMEWRSPAKVRGHFNRRVSYPLAATIGISGYYAWPIVVVGLSRPQSATILTLATGSLAITAVAMAVPILLMWIARLSFPILLSVYSVLTGGALMVGSISESGVSLPHIGRLRDFILQIPFVAWVGFVVLTLMLGLYAIKNFGPPNRGCQGRLLSSLILFIFWEIFLLFALVT